MLFPEHLGFREKYAAVPTTKKGPRLAIPQDLGRTDAAVISEVGTLIIHQHHVLQSQCAGRWCGGCSSLLGDVSEMLPNRSTLNLHSTFRN